MDYDQDDHFIANNKQMTATPELHYLSHLQNNSVGKQCSRFSKAARFRLPTEPHTQFKYNIGQDQAKLAHRCCKFPKGQRSQIRRNNLYPSPQQYRPTLPKTRGKAMSMAQGRQYIRFGTIASQIDLRSKCPAPNIYQLSEQKNANKGFSLRKRLPDDINISLGRNLPGPGQYEINRNSHQGGFPLSQHHKIRTVIMDCEKLGLQTHINNALGPGRYDIFNSQSKFSAQKIQKMRKTHVRIFGTGQRKGPQEPHRVGVPGPGMYQTFSTFGENLDYVRRHRTQQAA